MTSTTSRSNDGSSIDASQRTMRSAPAGRFVASTTDTFGRDRAGRAMLQNAVTVSSRADDECSRWTWR